MTKLTQAEIDQNLANELRRLQAIRDRAADLKAKIDAYAARDRAKQAQIDAYYAKRRR